MSGLDIPDVFHLARPNGERLCVYHAPATGPARAALVYVHPLAEEMNKSRRMAALQSRALAAAGCAVLRIDLHGCGDSSGDFADASWDDWVDDVVAACGWLRERVAAPLWLWGLRAGCLVAAAAAARLEVPPHLLFWQPTPNGRLVLQQFLRLRLAAQMIDGAGKAAMDEMRGRLAGGQDIEVAGYRLPAALAAGLERAQLAPANGVERLEWLELSGRPEPELAPASSQAIGAWQATGCRVESRIVPGVAFWQTNEIEDAPALVDATLAIFDASGAVR
ncbi:MAG: hypothetical protein V7632_3366 [Bradyrhizobium sp.]|jgi:exosortase A-associated hydrolase 2